MPNARQKILNYIVEQKTSTAEELSKVFHVTPADIRHHLSILVEQGSVKVIGQKPATNKGRPTQIYASCRQSELNNLDRLSHALLSALTTGWTSGAAIQRLDEIARHMGLEFKPDPANPTRRLYSAIHALNRMNYQAHWEAHFNHPRIMFGHCPYQAILPDHPELCVMDAALLGNLLAAPVRQIEKHNLDAKGLPRCVFLVSQTVP